MTKQEREHIVNVKSLPCGNCGASPPSDAHHIIENGTRVSHYATIPLCHEFCHQGSRGIHGDKTLLRIMKNTELKILAATMEKLYET